MKENKDVNLEKDESQKETQSGLLDIILFFYYKYINPYPKIKTLFYLLLGVFTAIFLMALLPNSDRDVLDGNTTTKQEVVQELPQEVESIVSSENDAVYHKEIYTFIKENQSSEKFYSDLIKYLKMLSSEKNIKISIESGNLVSLESLNTNGDMYIILERGFDTLKKRIRFSYYWRFENLNYPKDTILITLNNPNKIGAVIIVIENKGVM